MKITIKQVIFTLSFFVFPFCYAAEGNDAEQQFAKMEGELIPRETPVQAAAGDAPGRPENEAKGFKRPQYNYELRFEEDWSGLRCWDPCTTGDFFDPIKYVPLNCDGSVWATFGGDYRVRQEAPCNVLWTPGASDSYVYYRLLQHGDFHFGDNDRFFLQAGTSNVTHRKLKVGGKRIVDVAIKNLSNAFWDHTWRFCSGDTFTLRTGRQFIAFGEPYRERLVSAQLYVNVQRTFDGFTGIYKTKDWTVTGVLANLARLRLYNVADDAAHERFFGVYATGKVKAWTWPTQLDFYWLGKQKRHGFYHNAVGKETRHTFGARAKGIIPNTGWLYEFDTAYQIGKIGHKDINAYMGVASLGYQFKHVCTKPLLYLEVSHATGDRRRFDNRCETFDTLYPSGAVHFGRLGTACLQNIFELHPGIIVEPTSNTKAFFQIHALWRDTKADGMYNPGGIPTVPGFLGNARYIGTEYDTFVLWFIDKHTTGQVYYGFMPAGSFPKEFTQGHYKSQHEIQVTLEYTY